MNQTSALLLVFALVGCGSAATNHGLSPDPACDRYLACRSQTSPSTIAADLAAYGSASACWASAATAQACANACALSFEKISPQCTCLADADCPTIAPICNPGRHCDQCRTNDDCAALVPTTGLVSPSYPAYCRVAQGKDSGTCVTGCAVDADCKSATLYCTYRTQASGACVECDNTHSCPAGKACYSGTCS